MWTALTWFVRPRRLAVAGGVGGGAIFERMNAGFYAAIVGNVPNGRERA